MTDKAKKDKKRALAKKVTFIFFCSRLDMLGVDLASKGSC